MNMRHNVSSFIVIVMKIWKNEVNSKVLLEKIHDDVENNERRIKGLDQWREIKWAEQERYEGLGDWDWVTSGSIWSWQLKRKPS